MSRLFTRYILPFVIGCTFILLPHLGRTQVTINVDMETVLSTATKEHYGINFHQAFDPAIATNTAFQTRVQEINPGIVRYHAGEQIKEGDNKNWIDFSTKTWDKEKIDQVLNEKPADKEILMTITGWPSWMEDPNNSKRLHPEKVNDYAQFCANLVDVVNNQLGHNVRYWELFNEKDLSGGYDGTDDMVLLAAIHNTCRTAVKAVDENIVIVGPAFRTPWQSNVEDFLQAVGPGNLDIWSHHEYGNYSNVEDMQEVYNSADDMSRGSSSIRDKLDENGFQEVPIWLTEYNIFANWAIDSEQRRQNSIVGAIWDALAFKYCLEVGVVDAMFAWNAADGIYGKIKSVYDDFSGLHPAGMFFEEISSLGIGQVMKTTSDNEAMVQGFTIKDAEGKATFVLINRAEVAKTVFFSPGGWEPTNPMVNIISITANGKVKGEESWENLSSIAMQKDEILIIHSKSAGTITNIPPMLTMPGNVNLSLPCTSVKLNTTATDINGITSYQWTKLNGPDVVMIGADKEDLTLEGIVDEAEYEFKLEVTDTKGAIAQGVVKVFAHGYVEGVETNHVSLTNDFSGPMNNPVFNASANGSVSLEQDEELIMTMNDTKKYEKLLRMEWQNFTVLDLSENSKVSFLIKSAEVVKLRIKIGDVNDKFIDDWRFNYTTTGTNEYDTVRLDFADFSHEIDMHNIVEFQIMHKDDLNATGIVTVDDLKIGKVRVKEVPLDCHGDAFGTAYLDNCDVCVEGNTGLLPCEKDCTGEWGGDAVKDACGTCAGGTTGIIPVINPQECIATGIEDLNKEKVDVYPNPTTENVYLNKIVSWELKDHTGNILKKGTSDQLSLADLSPGLYFIRVKHQIIKVIKE